MLELDGEILEENGVLFYARLGVFYIFKNRILFPIDLGPKDNENNNPNAMGQPQVKRGS